MKIKFFLAIFFILNITGCFNKKTNFTNEQTNKINREIISNYNKAISKDPGNFNFYVERGKAKHDFGDFIGAIDDYDYSTKLNTNNIINFYKAKAKFSYGDFNGAITNYQTLINKKSFKDEYFFNLAISQFITSNYKDAIKKSTPANPVIEKLNLPEEERKAFLLSNLPASKNPKTFLSEVNSRKLSAEGVK